MHFQSEWNNQSLLFIRRINQVLFYIYSQLYRSSSFNSSGRSSNCDTTEDMYSDVSLEDVQDLNHKVIYKSWTFQELFFETDRFGRTVYIVQSTLISSDREHFRSIIFSRKIIKVICRKWHRHTYLRSLRLALLPIEPWTIFYSEIQIFALIMVWQFCSYFVDTSIGASLCVLTFNLFFAKNKKYSWKGTHSYQVQF